MVTLTTVNGDGFDLIAHFMVADAKRILLDRPLSPFTQHLFAISGDATGKHCCVNICAGNESTARADKRQSRHLKWRGCVLRDHFGQ